MQYLFKDLEIFFILMKIFKDQNKHQNFNRRGNKEDVVKNVGKDFETGTIY